MLCPPQENDPLVENWLSRHRDPASFALHMLGIPPTVLGVVLIPVYVALFSRPVFLLALALFVGGYLVQFLGHALEGTEPGEVMLMRRLWQGRGRTVEVVPTPRPRGIA